jgi:hypothetical protein
MPDIRSEGTLVQQNDKLYWFKNDFTGVEVPPPRAIALFESILGRKLTPFEVRLILSRPVDGSINITLVSKLVANADAPPGVVFLNSKRVVIGYVVRHREKASRYAFGDVIGTDRFCDIDGSTLGRISVTRRSEPGLETPLLDPIDFVGGALADFARLGAKALIRGITEGIEKKLAGSAAEELEEIMANRARSTIETLSGEQLDGISGGAARAGGEPKMTADQLNKMVPKANRTPGGRRLDTNERLGAIKVIGALERVSQTSAAGAEEIRAAIKRELPSRRVQELSRELKGWTEIDLLEGNTGWNNTMRLLYKVKDDVWTLRLLDMHGR